jgi:hypothetical protein
VTGLPTRNCESMALIAPLYIRLELSLLNGAFPEVLGTGSLHISKNQHLIALSDEPQTCRPAQVLELCHGELFHWVSN